MSERVDLQEFVSAFVDEAEELVAAANLSLLDIEVANREGVPRPRSVLDLFRGLHTIKGLAGMMGIEPIIAIAHALESLIRAREHAGDTLSHDALEITLEGLRAISQRVRAVAERRVVAELPAGLLDAIAVLEASGGTAVAATAVTATGSSGWDGRLSAGERQHLALALERGSPVWTVSFVPSEENASRGLTIASVRQQLAALGEIVKVIPRSPAVGVDGRRPAGVSFDTLLISTASPLAIAEAAATTRAAVVRFSAPNDRAPGPGSPVSPPEPGRREPTEASDDDHVTAVGRSVVRVELSRLDELQDQLSLLIVSRFRLEREIAALAALGHDVRGLRDVAQLQGRQLRDLRRAILSARMVRVAEILEPLNLLVRGLARTSQRSVQLQLEAHNTELDKTVADRVLPALIHLVRNAVDHAIELPEHRMARGKPAAGTIRVSCLAVAGNLIDFVVSDDGAGIDRAAIGERANCEIADDADLLDVLTAPGFTTRRVVTTTSGRGLGMDIIRRIAVDELGGELSMTTELGVGTSFTLRVPVTIAVMDVFSLQCGPQTFVVPAALVDEIFEVSPEDVMAAPRAGAPSRGATISLLSHRGQAIPLVSLGAMLAIDTGAQVRKALIVRRHGEALAFSVDRMLGRQEVVVRSIDDPLVSVPGIAGATDLGDGKPTLILDLHELAVMARERRVS